MRNTRFILSSAILTLLTFGAVVYTSCQKDRCKNLVCQHGGSCLNGFCTCPSGYSGDFCEIANITGIVYKNNTFTPVNITFSTATSIETKTIAAGKSYTTYGKYGDSIITKATTQGGYGEKVNWTNLTRKYPVRDTIQVDINLPSTYFYLFVRNNTTEPLRNVYVNYHTDYETLDILPIPVHVTYGIGYYKLFTNSNVRLEADTTFHYWQFDNLGLSTHPDSVNQNFTAEAL